MSTSLESLMREPAAPAGRSPVLAGMLSFIIIGGAAAVSFVGVSSAAVALFRTSPSWLVSALCYAAFIVPVYLLHRHFSFRSEAGHRRALPRYVLVQLVGVALATLFSFVSYGVIGLPTPVAAVLVIGLTSGINFVVLRLWAFSIA
jgi:putative flippase GtrA